MTLVARHDQRHDTTRNTGKEDGKFLLSTSRDTFVFECQSAEEGVEWMTALRDNIRRLLEKQATFEAAKLQGSSKNVS